MTFTCSKHITLSSVSRLCRLNLLTSYFLLCFVRCVDTPAHFLALPHIHHGISTHFVMKTARTSIHERSRCDIDTCVCAAVIYRQWANRNFFFIAYAAYNTSMTLREDEGESAKAGGKENITQEVMQFCGNKRTRQPAIE